MYTNMLEKSDVELIASVLGVKEERLEYSTRLANIIKAPRTIFKKNNARTLKKIYALNEITKRLLSMPAQLHTSIRSYHEAVNILMPKFRYEVKEHFDIIILDIRNNILAISNISIGTLDATIITPRDIFTEALKYPVSSIILAHNHPSGDPTPSNEDLEVTKRLVKCGELMKIKILDHIIIGDNKYTSLKEQGFIK